MLNQQHILFEAAPGVAIYDWEVQTTAIRSQGAGGQNVNKVASAIHLRFDVRHSSLLDIYKQRILQYPDQRITQDGVVIIKAQSHRTQELNKQDGLERLKLLIQQAIKIPKARRATRPSMRAKTKRLDQKNHRGKIKSLRGPVNE